MSNPQFSLGIIKPDGSDFFGVAEGVSVSATVLSIPFFGDVSSPSKIYDPAVTSANGSGFGIISSFTVNLTVPLPVGAVALTANIKNVTTGLTMGSGIVILAGSANGFMNGGASVLINPGDQVVLTLSVSGSPTVLPQIQWYAN